MTPEELERRAEEFDEFSRKPRPRRSGRCWTTDSSPEITLPVVLQACGRNSRREVHAPTTASAKGNRAAGIRRLRYLGIVRAVS